VVATKLLTTDVLEVVLARTLWDPPGEIRGGFSFGWPTLHWPRARATAYGTSS
jgi:hypothetical protein